MVTMSTGERPFGLEDYAKRDGETYEQYRVRGAGMAAMNPPRRQQAAALERRGEAKANSNGHKLESDAPASLEPPPDDEPPLYADVAALLDGTLPEPPRPALLTRTDGHALFYAGRVNFVFGDPEAGKTWVVLAACVEALRAGRRVLVIDLDHNGVEAVVSNLLLLDAPTAALRDRGAFRYCDPAQPGEVHMVVADCQAWRPAVVVVDSLGELLPMVGASSNSADEFTITHARVLKPLAARGAAVIAVDHLAKNPDSRAHGPGGTIAKRRAVGGVSIRVTARRQFVPGKGGSAALIVNKDRHGGVRKHCPAGEREPLAGTFVMDPADAHGAVRWRVLPPLDIVGPAASLDDKTAGYLAAAREVQLDTFTAKDLAAAMPDAEHPPTNGQRKQAAYHADKLVDAGLLQQISKGRRGGGAGRWRVAEPKSDANPTLDTTPQVNPNPTKSQGWDLKSETPCSGPNPTPNPTKSQTL